MKKLFALMLALCLLCSFALAEEETPVLNWADYSNNESVASGSFQQVTFPDIVTLLYWVPGNMAAFDVNLIQADIPPVAAFATEDGNYTISVFALNITSLEAYLTELQSKGTDKFRNVTVNGIDCVSCENEETSIDILVVPITETQVLVYNFTPLNGDDDWDATKAVIVASIQVAQ